MTRNVGPTSAPDANRTGHHRRQRRKVLTDKQVAALPRKSKRWIMSDPEMRGLYLRIPVEGPVVYAAVARDPLAKRQVWATFGDSATLTIEEAREQARAAIKRIREGLEPFAPPPVKPDSVEAVARNWLERHVEARGLRTGPEVRRIIEKYVLPHWRARVFADIKRSDIAKLLDHIEDAHGAWVADATLAVLRTMASWYAARDDSYTPPFVKSMKRVPAQERRRNRVLSDNELQLVWRAAEAAGTYGALIRVLMLSAQRRSAVVHMKWADLDGDVWNIPKQTRANRWPVEIVRAGNGDHQFVAEVRQQRLRLCGISWQWASRRLL
jgi:Arm DNA-binding domain